MEKTEAAQVLGECAASRELEAKREMTIPEAIAAARWLESTPDAVLAGEQAKTIIQTLHAALQASPCYYKGAREGIPTFTLLAYDLAGHHAIRVWAGYAQNHGARPEKYESAIGLVYEWQNRTDLRWPT